MISDGEASAYRLGTGSDARDTSGLTKLDSFLQIFCLFQGTCFFLFPGFLKDVGMIPGLFLGLFITLVYLYLAHLYFWSERQLKNYDPSVEAVSFYAFVELVFARIGKLPRLGRYAKYYLRYEIILSWYLGMSFSLLFVCKNFKLILHNFAYEMDERTILLYLTLPLALVCFTPNLVTLNKAFYLSSVVIIAITLETFYYIFTDERSLPKMNLFGSLEAIPTYVNNIIFTINMTPLLFLYRLEMRRERDFTSLFGSLNTSICATIFLCMVYSITCNIRYGNDVRENIIENLPDSSLVNVSNTIMTLTMMVSGSVVFYGIFLCLWEGALDKLFTGAENVERYKYAVKGTVFIFVIGVTAFTPSLSDFLNLLSSFSLPYDTCILPVALETVIVYRLNENTRTLKKVYVLLKNSVITLVAVSFAVWSLTDAVRNIFFRGNYGGDTISHARKDCVVNPEE